MEKIHNTQDSVVVIGAGPAGLFAAKFLADEGVSVALINRDIKPGGLAEYGIFHNKHKMKNGLRKQFNSLLESPNIHYFGNIVVGKDGDIQLDDLKEMGFKGVIVTVGAQGTKWLGLPGEELTGVYHAKNLVYHYNQLPPFSEEKYPIGDKVALIGAGNVMLDLAHYCIRDRGVGEVTAVVRRGPADVKFTKKEMAHVVSNLDQNALDEEIARTAPVLDKVGQDAEAARDFIISCLSNAEDKITDTRFQFKFLVSPKAILGQDGKVTGLEVENTTLELREDGSTKSVSLGTTEVIDCDTVIFCIGDKVDPSLGLPLDKWNEFAKHPNPRYPVLDTSYEAYDPEKKEGVEGVFLAGWAREASSGLVGMARKDGENCAKALLRYLDDSSSQEASVDPMEKLDNHLKTLKKPVVRKSDLETLTAIEIQKANQLGLEAFKFPTNAEMLNVMGLEVGEPQLLGK